jgi:hypothetical protein
VRALRAQKRHTVELPNLLQLHLLVVFIAAHLFMADGENAMD